MQKNCFRSGIFLYRYPSKPERYMLLPWHTTGGSWCHSVVDGTWRWFLLLTHRQAVGISQGVFCGLCKFFYPSDIHPRKNDLWSPLPCGSKIFLPLLIIKKVPFLQGVVFSKVIPKPVTVRKKYFLLLSEIEVKIPSIS